MAVMSKSSVSNPQHSASMASDGSSLDLNSGSNSAAGSRGQLGDDIIIDDGIDERTVVIEQHGRDF